MTSGELLERIQQLVEEEGEQSIAALCEILRCRTVSGESDPEKKQEAEREIRRCLEYLEKLATSMGFEWRNHDNRVAVAELPHEGEFVGLPVHVDVVPAGDGWTYDPFAGEIVDGKIYGRGTQDDKGPVIQMLWAMKILKRLDVKLRRGVRLIIGTTEEFGEWTDLDLYFQREPMPAMAIVPDADFPVVNGEKGVVNVQIRLRFPLGEGQEDGEIRLVRVEGGRRPNMVPDHAEALFTRGDTEGLENLQRELQRFLTSEPNARAEIVNNPEENYVKLVFHGRSAHGSRPELGHNAVLDLLYFLGQSAFTSDDEADVAQFIFANASDMYGKTLGIDSEHPFVGRTTVSLGIFRWDDEGLSAVLNVRPTYGMPVQRVLENIKKAVDDFAQELGIESEIGSLAREPFDAIYVDESSAPELIAALREAYTTVTGRPFEFRSMGGTTYAKAFKKAVNFGPTDPVEEPEMAHQPDEHVRVDCHLRNIKLYAYALARLCGDA
ncbi:MAG: Sapep family Mn(2+)-dependent dipeptidase [Candidatus Sumerlaeaceae bacterium]|nr:Sapep family Mn(2+)-dependent dipeptidase [Candidatus Sumerlaeaceae bacterium]